MDEPITPNGFVMSNSEISDAIAYAVERLCQSHQSSYAASSESDLKKLMLDHLKTLLAIQASRAAMIGVSNE